MSREESIDWFHGRLSRPDAENILMEESKKSMNTNVGIFLVRESSTLLNNYVLSVIYRDEFYHYQIQQHGEDAFFSIDSQSIHHGLDDMIEYYRHFDSNLCTKLDKFVKKSSPPTKYCRLGKANLLHRATKHNNLNVVKELLTSSYRNLDAKDELGMTAVHLAAINSVNPEIMKLLIEKGAQVQSRDSEGNTSLHYACRYQCIEMVEMLVSANKSLIHTRNSETGVVPIHEAAKVGNMEIVKFLLTNKAASMPRTVDGIFPSDFARENNHHAVADFLENYKPTVNTFTHKWHHGTLGREGARTLLLQKRNELYEKLKEEYPQEENAYVNDSKEINDLISGLFLVRSSERNKGLDVITMLHDDDEHKNIKNYVINKFGKYLYIDDGPYMPSLEHLISYYMHFADGLPVKLSRIVEPIPKPPVPVPSTMLKHMKQKSFDSVSPTKGSLPQPSTSSAPQENIPPKESPNKSSNSIFNSLFRKKKHSLPTSLSKEEKLPEAVVLTENFNKSLSFSTDFLNNHHNASNGESYDVPKRAVGTFHEGVTYFTESDKNLWNNTMKDNLIEEIYFVDPPKKMGERQDWNQLDPELYDTQKNLMKEVNQQAGANYYVSKEDLKLEREIGSGEFGNVLRGILRLANGRKIWVAVKTLHKEHYQENLPEFLREASVMIKLDNPFIVKLIGITRGPPLGLVQELLLLGSLASYLVDHEDEIENKDIDLWASQIAQGMEYLESKRFVHRDLAARNILLAKKDHCKISDFGLSRAVGVDNDFYQSSTGGRWPLKWYAPESFCGKFSHASDVWSFAITLWELYSKGQTPYGDMSGAEVNELIENGQRLGKPETCPDDVYNLMLDCWQYRDRLRPNFQFLSKFFINRLQNDEQVQEETSDTVYV